MLGNNALGENTTPMGADATATITGVSAAADVGTVTASGGASASVTVTGVSSAATVGTATASGGASTTLAGVSAAASVGTASAAAGVQQATRATVSVVDATGAPRAGLTGLKWAFFDQLTLDQFRAPSAQGVGASTDGSGHLTVNITGTSLQPGQVGILAFSDGNGDIAQTPPASAFLGPVMVS
jgi:hypothetical protein